MTPAGRPPTLLTATVVGSVVAAAVDANLTNVVAQCLLFFYKIDVGDLPKPMF